MPALCRSARAKAHNRPREITTARKKVDARLGLSSVVSTYGGLDGSYWGNPCLDHGPRCCGNMPEEYVQVVVLAHRSARSYETEMVLVQAGFVD